MNLDSDSLRLLAEAVEHLRSGFTTGVESEGKDSEPSDPASPVSPPGGTAVSAVQEDAESNDGTAHGPAALDLGEILLETAERLHDNFPYHSPLYVGQMLKPPHPVAHLAYTLAMCLNPNNHAHDGGRASSAMEKECIAQLARMVGWPAGTLGHLCGGGTIANFEGLWVSRELSEKPGIAASQQAHYTHSRLSSVLSVPFHEVAVDARGRMDVGHLSDLLEAHPIGTVVVTLGTTALGAVDPLEEVLRLRERHGFRIHVDAAYGGYFTLAGNLAPETRRSFDRLSEADSIVIDPHKHGLQPYGCGCILFRDREAGKVYKHDSPYTYFTSDELHLGEISLECSRAGAAAVALWATMKRFPLTSGGAFAFGLERGRSAALQLHAWLTGDDWFVPLMEPELDVVVWTIRMGGGGRGAEGKRDGGDGAKEGTGRQRGRVDGGRKPLPSVPFVAPSPLPPSSEAHTASEASRLARCVFDEAAREGLHLALASMPRALVEPVAGIEEWDTDTVTCLRACAMKPEHQEAMPEIIRRLSIVADRVLADQKEQGPGRSADRI
jgi:tyrosine decarboxylase / aspartate 1-decarboxylase